MLTHPHDSIIGDVPTDWEIKPIRSLLQSQTSGDWGAENGEEPITVIRSTNFTNDGSLRLAEVATRYFPAAKAGEMALLTGDLLVERSGGGPDQAVGRIAFVREDFARTTVSNFVQILRPNASQVDPSYLGWTLFEMQRTGLTERVQQQSTQMRNLQWRDYMRLRVPFPPIEEQRRIAAALKLADDAIAKAKAELDATRRLKRTLLQDLFKYGVTQTSHLNHSKWITCPAHWSIEKLRDFATVKSGFTMGRDLSRQETITVPYVTVINVQEGRFVLDQISSIEIRVNELDSHGLKFGDVLMTEGGDRDKLGRGGMWRDEVSPCSYQNHIFRVRLDHEVYLPQLFHHLIQTYQAKNYFFAHAKQTSNLCTINSRELRNWRVPIPPLDEQKEMAATFDAVDDAIVSGSTKIAALEASKKSLLQNLLTGKVRIPGGLFDE